MANDPTTRSVPRSVPLLWKTLAFTAAVAVAAAAEGQNLVTNGGFDTGLGGWTVGDGNTQVTWSPLDAAGSPGSGSARFENPAVEAFPRSLTQCIEVGAQATVRLAARYRLEGGGSGYASISALQFTTPDCSGSPFFLPGARQDGEILDVWSEISSTPTLSEGFRAIRVSVGVVGNGRAAHFDDVEVEQSGGGGPIGDCQPDATTLCLASDRYEVRAKWRTASDDGQGHGVEIEDGAGRGTGYFWFFNPANVEVVVKVIEACGPPFHSVWVFAGGLTNQEVELRVTDTQTGVFWTHLNPLGQVWSTVADTEALDVCD